MTDEVKNKRVLVQVSNIHTGTGLVLRGEMLIEISNNLYSDLKKSTFKAGKTTIKCLIPADKEDTLTHEIVTDASGNESIVAIEG